ncbi:MAG: replicative DNA helicase [Sterolibacteriaceae bacterium]|uniref:Replicative DNA helicase n=1 Tax=Candidatus Methylophosphatis roskildensis TaxID=2899263 RepID=A0A9D7HNN3_9PROT|nr:replicative DNA helicase [Candidatus Methylophosphatis roskildensis]MBK7237361.1 replicative DNA helicase [Sterolibacteriaceae bacterium]
MAQTRSFQTIPIDPQVAALRLPPNSIEAEQSLIGGLLLDNMAWDKIADIVAEFDFYRDDHRRIFRHIARLIEVGRPADVVTVFESLEKSNESEQAGGLAYLGEIANNTPSAANIKRYAEIVRERAILRKLVTAGDEIASSALNPAGRDATQILDEAEAKVFEIAEQGARQNTGFVGIQPLLAKVVERIQELCERDGSDVTGMPTGYTDLDQKTSGMQPGDMIIVAGRPSMGKTAFALNIAEHVAVEMGQPVAIFSMEMPGTQLAMRFLSSIGKLDQHRVRTGRLNDDEWQRLTYSLGKLHEAPIHIDETPALNATELRARARRLFRQYGKLGLIVIDYLQLMSSVRDNENRATELSEISRSVKALAKELNVPVVALSQLSRNVEQRTNRRPIMSDLRESGAIEQDADLIQFIYRDEVYNPDSPDKGTAEIIIAKQRNGPIGTVRLTFLGEYTKFENFASPGSY